MKSAGFFLFLSLALFISLASSSSSFEKLERSVQGVVKVAENFVTNFVSKKYHLLLRVCLSYFSFSFFFLIFFSFSFFFSVLSFFLFFFFFFFFLFFFFFFFFLQTNNARHALTPQHQRQRHIIFGKTHIDTKVFSPFLSSPFLSCSFPLSLKLPSS